MNLAFVLDHRADVDPDGDVISDGSHVSLPNGLGLDHVGSGARHQTRVAPNELTASEDRDPWAGTPWHKTVPARLERVPA